MLSTFSPAGRFITIEYNPDTNTITHTPVYVNGANAIVSFTGKDPQKNRRFDLTNADITFEPNTDPQWTHSHRLKINVPDIHIYGLDTPILGAPTVNISYRFEGRLIFQMHGTGELFDEDYIIILKLQGGLNHQNKLYDKVYFYPLNCEYDKDTGDLTCGHQTLYLLNEDPHITKAKSFIQKTYVNSGSKVWSQVFDYSIVQQVKDSVYPTMKEVWLSLKKTDVLNQIPNGFYNIKGIFTGIPPEENPNEISAVEALLTIKGTYDPVKITPTQFIFNLDINENDKGVGMIDVLNYEEEPTLTFSQNLKFVKEDAITGGKTFSFETKRAELLGLGQHSEEVIVKHKQSTKRIPITINVEGGDLPSNHFFCKDNNTFSFPKKYGGNYNTPGVTDSFLKVKMIIVPNIVQIYHFPFFKGKATIRHGDLVQPFLKYATTFSKTLVEEREYVSFPFFNPYEVIFVVEEIVGDGALWHEEITHFYYPGKRPKAFPFLTNATLRTTTGDSLVVLPYINTFKDNKHIRDTFKGVELKFKGGYTENKPYWVNMVCFTRKNLKQSYKSSDILQFKPMNLEPKPDLQRSINAIFINQNYVPDWFTFDGFWEDDCKIEHTLTTDMVDGTHIKKGTKREVTIKLSTGFIFQEEVDLVRELIESDIVFLKIDSKWHRAIPISEKTVANNTSEVLYIQIVEFKLLEDTEKVNDKLYNPSLPT
ncbi:hypothetical protein CAPN008_20350 [Capnocytophaga canis]|uniref:hypothetical protein n=1 Tax=Capnocytophaga canis TaxID=1848903 RepID=UPI001AD0BE64|nr:hypothetical protein [Capnocytophaga canis]GIM61985.1 hypothetical protein CAPN008_20350 [Capnocytophaga canis]